jgi:hypothetical protein
MEDVFEVLIYLFIIISVLSGIFKKKKKAQQQPQQNLERVQNLKHERSSPEFDVKEEEKPQPDFIKELESFFKVGIEDQPKFVQPKPLQKDEVKMQTEIEKTIESEGWHTETKSEHTFVDPWDAKRIKVKEQAEKVDSAIEKQAAKFEELLTKKESAASEISKKIRHRLSDPTSLKDYIIISEIMGKPKSRRG